MSGNGLLWDGGPADGLSWDDDGLVWDVPAGRARRGVPAGADPVGLAARRGEAGRLRGWWLARLGAGDVSVGDLVTAAGGPGGGGLRAIRLSRLLGVLGWPPGLVGQVTGWLQQVAPGCAGTVGWFAHRQAVDRRVLLAEILAWGEGLPAGWLWQGLGRAPADGLVWD